MVILYKKGTGEAQKFDPFRMDSVLKTGLWCLTQKDALTPEMEKEPEPKETPEPEPEEEQLEHLHKRGRPRKHS